MTHHKIFDVQTGEETIIPFTDKEMAEYEIAVKKQEELKKANETAEAAKIEAQAKLEALGLNATDLKALGL